MITNTGGIRQDADYLMHCAEDSFENTFKENSIHNYWKKIIE